MLFALLLAEPFVIELILIHCDPVYTVPDEFGTGLKFVLFPRVNSKAGHVFVLFHRVNSWNRTNFRPRSHDAGTKLCRQKIITVCNCSHDTDRVSFRSGFELVCFSYFKFSLITAHYFYQNVVSNYKFCRQINLLRLGVYKVLKR